MTHWIKLLLAGAALALSSSASASLLGDTVTCSGIGLPCNSSSAVVGAGTEFFTTLGGSNNVLGIDIGASSISITNVLFTGAGFGAPFSFTLGSLDDSLGDIVGITNFTTSGSDIVASDVSFTAHSISFDYSNSGWSRSATASFDLVIGPASVPEPATLVLFGIGLASIGFSRRRKLN